MEILKFNVFNFLIKPKKTTVPHLPLLKKISYILSFVHLIWFICHSTWGTPRQSKY